MPKISVIIPVYNTEKFLREALDSIINQSFKDIEIIAINDGSTDNCLEILNEYAKNDNRLKVYSQENQGQAIARNFGLDNSSGDYIYFFDSDDILLPTALEETYNKCKKDNLDFCFFDADIFYDDIEYNLSFDYKRSHLLEDKVYSGLEITNILLDHNKFRASPCLYLLKKGFWKGLKLYFENIIYEDELFGSLLYIQAERVGFVPKSFFLRRVRGNSTMTKQYAEKNLYSHFFILDQFILFSKKNGKCKNVINRFCMNIVNVAVYSASSLSFKLRINCVLKVLRKYANFIRLKPILVCMFPFIINNKMKNV